MLELCEHLPNCCYPVLIFWLLPFRFSFTLSYFIVWSLKRPHANSTKLSIHIFFYCLSFVNGIRKYHQCFIITMKRFVSSITIACHIVSIQFNQTHTDWYTDNDSCSSNAQTTTLHIVVCTAQMRLNDIITRLIVLLYMIIAGYIIIINLRHNSYPSSWVFLQPHLLELHTHMTKLS